MFFLLSTLVFSLFFSTHSLIKESPQGSSPMLFSATFPGIDHQKSIEKKMRPSAGRADFSFDSIENPTQNPYRGSFFLLGSAFCLFLGHYRKTLGSEALALLFRFGGRCIAERVIACPFFDLNARHICLMIDGKKRLNEILSFLLDHPGMIIDMRKKWGNTPLQWASFYDQTHLFLALLKQPNILVNQCDSTGTTPLHIAIFKNNVTLLDCLLKEKKIDVSRGDRWGNTPLLYAVGENNLLIACRLLHHSPHAINTKNKRGNTPLLWASRYGHTAIVQRLLTNPSIEVNASDINGDTPLLRASRHGHTAIVQCLLANPSIEVNASDINGDTPLFEASENGHGEIVRELLAHPLIAVNRQGKGGYTPLHIAAFYGHIDIVRILLKNPRIQPDLCDEKGKNAIDYLKNKGSDGDFNRLYRDLLPYYDHLLLGYLRENLKAIVLMPFLLNVKRYFGMHPLENWLKKKKKRGALVK